MAKQSKRTETQPQSLDDIVADTFRTSIEYLQKQIALVIAGKAGKSKHDPAYRVASLTRMIAQVVAEQRKSDAATRKLFDSYNHAGVIAWARSISQQERRTLIGELVTLDQKGSILS